MTKMEAQQLLSVAQAESLYPFARGMLYKIRYRAQLGLPCVKLGRRIFFRPQDLEAVIEKNFHPAPMMPGEGERG